MISLNKSLHSLLSLIEKEGYDAYVVGGYLRDYFLKIETDDYDIATNMPLNLLESFKDIKIINKKGSSFLSIKIEYDNLIFEVTNLRKEGVYLNVGYPSHVELTSDIYIDLSRRDFSINSLAFSLKKGLIDPYKGQEDIKNKIIKTIKDPYLSYKEDPTRIIRAIRFASKYDFDIDSNNLKAIKENKDLLKKLSRHQLEREITKLKKVCNNKTKSLLSQTGLSYLTTSF